MVGRTGVEEEDDEDDDICNANETLEELRPLFDPLVKGEVVRWTFRTGENRFVVFVFLLVKVEKPKASFCKDAPMITSRAALLIFMLPMILVVVVVELVVVVVVVVVVSVVVAVLKSKE